MNSLRLAVWGALILSTPQGASAAASDATVVDIRQGALTGRTDGKITSFKGVPFARPPIGRLRWKAPLPPRPWKGMRNAIKAGPACIQNQADMAAPYQSEDCLNLNIWKPATARKGSSLPTMVWIYGGAFGWGSNSDPMYDGTHFAERDVILVTINYRLGALGFFAHPALTAEDPNGLLGNFGIMDTIEALRWVKANIAAFGGDPDNVTIFGESAGGVIVNLLMASPRAEGLFAKAISQSSFADVGFRQIRGTGATESVEQTGLRLADRLGVHGTNAQAARGLRALPAASLVSVPNGGGTSATLASFRPMIDGRLVAERPAEAFAAGREAKVPFMIGGNSWEASLMPLILQNPEGTLAKLGSTRSRVEALYKGELAAKVQDIKTDVSSTEPARRAAVRHMKNGQNAYAYYFSYVPPAQRRTLPGAAHGSEIPFLFNNLKPEGSKFFWTTYPPLTDEDRAISSAMMTYWTNFARTGVPGTVGGDTWPAVSPNNAFLEIGPVTVAARPHFKQDRLDALEGAPLQVRHPVP